MRISKQKIAMDLYDDSFKIQDMIDSDLRSIRTELDEYFSELPHAPGSPILSHPSLSMDISENTLDSELSDDGRIGWMNSSQMYNVSSDLDSINGLLVNPETALPVSISQLSALSSSTVNVTVTPGKTETDVESDTVKMPVQVITAKTSFVSETESKQSKVSFTIAVPSMPTDEVPQEEIDERQVPKVTALQKLKDVEDSPKSRSRQKQNTKFSGTLGNEENSYPKPAYSYSCLIAMALKNSKTGSLPVNEIYDFMIENFPYFKTAPNGWKNSVRHNLSLNKCFEKIEKPSGNGAQRKGYLWALNPSKAEKMEEELQKWSSRDPAAIRKSMANPERLELIEKGELKKNDGSAGLLSVSVIKKSSSKDGECKNSSSGSTSNEVTNTEFSPLGEPVGMDSSLSDLDLQKGLWENLGDDRLQFVSNSPMSSSSPKNTEPNPEMDEDSLPGTSPSSPTKSFVHAHYIYSHLEKTNTKGDTSLKHELCSSEVEDHAGSVP